MSGNQIDNLGKRLARNESISDEDYRLLAQVADAWQAVLDQVEAQLQNLGFQATTRVKTTGTLRDKLRRPGAPMLKDVHDLAGARIIVSRGGRAEQDVVGAKILEAFADCPKASLVVDRRKSPSYGYRALHLVVFPEKIPVEIQIRTQLQDLWAQLVEKLGDQWGRGIRYGSGPDDPDAPSDLVPGLTRAEAWVIVMELADCMDAFEFAVQGERLAADAIFAATDPVEQSRLIAQYEAGKGRYEAASAALDRAMLRLTGNDDTPGESG